MKNYELKPLSAYENARLVDEDNQIDRARNDLNTLYENQKKAWSNLFLGDIKGLGKCLQTIIESPRKIKEARKDLILTLDLRNMAYLTTLGIGHPF